MRFVLQRVKHASVKVDGELIGSIGRGYMVLMGVSDTDTEEITDKMVDKMCKLRIFEDENGKTNCSLADVDGEILLPPLCISVPSRGGTYCLWYRNVKEFFIRCVWLFRQLEDGFVCGRNHPSYPRKSRWEARSLCAIWRSGFLSGCGAGSQSGWEKSDLHFCRPWNAAEK